MMLVAPVFAAEAEPVPGDAGRLTLELAKHVIEEVIPEVESIRGLAFKSDVPVEVVSDDQARAHILDRVDEFGMREQLSRTQQAYRLLGLLPPDVDILEAFLAALREQAGGFYLPSTKSFYLLDDMPAGAVRVLTAHELTHALEDQHFDLDKRLLEVMDDDDRLFARGAVHEGSATLLMTVYTTKAMLAGQLDLAAIQRYEQEFGSSGGLEQLPPVLLRQLLGPYVLGPGFLARGGLAAVALNGFPVEDTNRAFRDGPQSSEQILHPQKYWSDDDRDDPRPVDLGDAGSVLGRRWRKASEGVLGEISLAVMTGADTPTDAARLLLQGGRAWTNEAASGWGGDRWQLWRKGRSAVALLLTVWDTEGDAREFAAALESNDLAVRRRGDGVAVVAGDARKRTEALLGAMLDSLEPGP